MELMEQQEDAFMSDVANMPTIHDSHGCQLADVDYYRSLYRCVLACASDGCNNNNSGRLDDQHVVIFRKKTSKLSLCGALAMRIAHNYSTMHGNADEERAIYVLAGEIAAVASLNCDKETTTKFNLTQVHVLLWCAIRSLDLEKLQSALDKWLEVVPSCVLSSLLLQSADLLFDEAVDVLLRHGADPNNSAPLVCALRNVPPHYLERHPDPEKTWERRLANIVVSLIRHGAKLVPNGNYNGNHLPIHCICQLACNGIVEAVDAIMEAASPGEINFYPEINSHNGYQPRSALSLSLTSFKQRFFLQTLPDRYLLIMGGNTNNQLSLQQHQQQHTRTGPTRVMKHAVLPLLRAGAALPKDPLDFFNCGPNLASLQSVRMEDWLNYYRSLFLLPAKIDEHHQLQENNNNKIASILEGNDYWIHYYFKLIIEARMASSLNVAVFCAFVQANGGHLRQRELQFASFARSEFPRSLQSQCRVAVLRNLPGGLRQRSAAISQLHLPGCLGEFLQFAEFDLPLRRLEEHFHNQKIQQQQQQQQLELEA